MAKEILVLGHKNPDTDSICSAIAYSALKNKTGENTIPIRLGEINKETEYVLKHFDVKEPKLQTDISGESVILVDHNERTQTADGFEEAKILELVDHHRISNFHTDEPLKVRMDIVGCTSTLVFELYKEAGLLPEKNIAGLMLSAIVSDTLLFKSPTCTERDVKAARELAVISETDLEKYGLDMLIAGTNLDDKTNEELLNMDMKIFEIGELKLAVAQVSAVDINKLLDKKSELEKSADDFVAKENLDLFMFVITDILNNNSVAIAAGNKTDIAEKAFGQIMNDRILILDGVVSRKKQIIPPLTKAVQN
jgi:manganese-dependent inorganic pyrophosphatase